MRFYTLTALSGAFSLALAQTAPPAGLLMVLSKPTHPDLTVETFNTWYSGPHIHDMVASGVTDLVLRYKNVNASAKFPYLALYRLPDVRKLSDSKLMGAIPSTSQLLPGKTKGSKGGDYKDVMDMETRAYARTQTFEGQIKLPGRGKALITAAMSVQNGTEGEMDDWYRRQHLDMISMIKGYHRSTRYEKLDKSSPRFLAMHELDSVTMGPEMKLVLGTEWAKKVLSKVTASSNEVWEYITEFGKEGLTEAQLKF